MIKAMDSLSQEHIKRTGKFLIGVVCVLLALFFVAKILPGVEYALDVTKKAPDFIHYGTSNGQPWLSAPSIKIKNIATPNISAKAYIIGDVQSGQIIAERRSDTVVPIASITKLMTAIISEEHLDLKKKISITSSILATRGTSGNLVEGEKISAKDILYPLLMESSNDAAKAISSTYGEGKFINLMNQKAYTLGMSYTTFADSAGLSNKNISSAQDLFRLMQYITIEKPFILGITKLPTKEFATRGAYHELRNANLFMNDPRFLGGKVGFTSSAQETMVTVFNLPTQGNDHTIAIIVLGSKKRDEDIGRLLGWYEEATDYPTQPTLTAKRK